MNENTVRKIKLEFEIPHNHSELSLLIIPEAEFQLETKNLDIISGLQEIFTLRYVQNTPNSNQKDYLHPLQTTDELTGEEAFLTSHPQGSEILYKVKSNKKRFYKFSTHIIDL